MSVFHGQTRFDDPRIPQDLATKLYVDDRGGQTFARVIKLVDQTVNNSTTLIDDDELFFTPNINKEYFGVMYIYMSSISTADIKHAFSLPTDCVGRWLGPVAYVRHSEQVTAGITSPILVGVNTVGERTMAQYFHIQMSGTAGTIQYQWAQGTAQVADTKVLLGTTFVIWESP